MKKNLRQEPYKCITSESINKSTFRLLVKIGLFPIISWIDTAIGLTRCIGSMELSHVPSSYKHQLYLLGLPFFFFFQGRDVVEHGSTFSAIFTALNEKL